MATVRWGRADFEGTVANHVRWGRADFEGTAPASTKVRWGRADFDGVAAVVLAPLTDLTVEPESFVTLTTTVTSGQTADAWTWRRISGPAVTLTGTGGTRTLYAPSAMPPSGATVVIGVTATASGITSPERTVTVTARPQLSWQWQSGAWYGRRPAIALFTDFFDDTFGDSF